MYEIGPPCSSFVWNIDSIFFFWAGPRHSILFKHGSYHVSYSETTRAACRPAIQRRVFAQRYCRAVLLPIVWAVCRNVLSLCNTDWTRVEKKNTPWTKREACQRDLRHLFRGSFDPTIVTRVQTPWRVCLLIKKQRAEGIFLYFLMRGCVITPSVCSISYDWSRIPRWSRVHTVEPLVRGEATGGNIFCSHLRLVATSRKQWIDGALKGQNVIAIISN